MNRTRRWLHSPAFDLGWFAGPPLFAALLIPLLALPQATHYLLDAWLWRFDGSNPGLRERILGLTGPGTSAIISKTP